MYHPSPLQPEEEAETVFDVEPSSTTSTPTSLVSFCLHPGDKAGGWGLARVAHSNDMGEHQYLVPTPGYWGGAGTPGLPLLTQQDLAQVQMLPWPWLKSGVRRSSSSSAVSRSHPERREPEMTYSIREAQISESSTV